MDHRRRSGTDTADPTRQSANDRRENDDGDRLVRPSRRSVVAAAQVVGEDVAAVLVVMAVGAEVLPIAAIGWIVVMIAVAMMDGQQMQGAGIELARALGADPSMQRQRALAIALGALRGLRPRGAHERAGIDGGAGSARLRRAERARHLPLTVRPARRRATRIVAAQRAAPAK